MPPPRLATFRSQEQERRHETEVAMYVRNFDELKRAHAPPLAEVPPIALRTLPSQRASH